MLKVSRNKCALSDRRNEWLRVDCLAAGSYRLRNQTQKKLSFRNVYVCVPISRLIKIVIFLYTGAA